MDGYFDVEKLRAQIQLWMPDKDGDPCHDGERLAYNSVLQFMKPARENPRFQSWDERAQKSWNFGK